MKKEESGNMRAKRYKKPICTFFVFFKKNIIVSNKK